jgi:predicted PurR-regulated permease PerM
MLRKVEVSHRTIVFAALFLIGLWFLYSVRDIILELFVALFLMTILEPMVARLTKIKIPRAISVLLTYILVIGIFGGLIALVVPSLVDQTASFINALPGYMSNTGIRQEWSDQIVAGFLATASTIPGQLFQFTFLVFNNVLAIISVLVFAFYMLVAREKLEDQLGIFFGEEKKKQLGKILDSLETRLGGWARGELILMFMVGLGVYVGLRVVGIPFALPLSILSGILEIIPIIGPILSAIPGIIIGFGISPVTGLGVAALYFLVHQLENYILVPKIMEKSIGVSPIVTLIALAVGARMAGIVGAIISVPLFITLQVLVKEYLVKE